MHADLTDASVHVPEHVVVVPKSTRKKPLRVSRDLIEDAGTLAVSFTLIGLAFWLAGR